VNLEASLALERDVAEVARARRFVMETLQSWGLNLLEADAVLLASETVTNAVTYTDDGPILLRVSAHEGRLRIAVQDPSPAIPRSAGLPLSGSTSGRGIAIVKMLAVDFGVKVLGGEGKIVWFDLSTELARS
jgi:anti-sigma regulatory factor (Ser/Thr protein kinase)